MPIRKKLYFDFILTNVPTTGKIIRLRATSLAATTTNGYQNTSRTGDFLASLAPLTASSPTVMKHRNEVQLQVMPSFLDTSGTVKPGLNVIAMIANASGSTSLAFLTVGGGAVANKRGNSSVFTRDFSILLRAWAVGTGAGTGTVRGVLVAQREHTMDV